MHVIICGGRDFIDYGFAFRMLNQIHKECPITQVIEGGQRTRDKHTREIIGGADYWGMRWAKRNGIECITMRADWNKYGKAAGMIRNKRMLEEGKPDCVIAFKGGNGTANMMEIARTSKIEVIEIKDLS